MMFLVSQGPYETVLSAQSVRTSLSAVYQVLDLVFMIALGTSLLLGLSAGSPTSNKRIEQNASR